MSPAEEAAELLAQLGVDATRASWSACSPIDGQRDRPGSDRRSRCGLRAGSRGLSRLAYDPGPAPRRAGAAARRRIARARSRCSRRLITLEAGKIVQESLGEVQEMIDICDFAVGLSRQLYGLTIASERPDHRMMEQWHPLGPVLVISAFNFPVAVWAWNAALALVCGDPVIWKPSEKTPLCAEAVMALVRRALRAVRRCARRASSRSCRAAAMSARRWSTIARVALVSATGSTAMGRAVGPRVAQRFGRALLELGGNNATIVCPSADLELAARAILFSAAGTAGQRCTTLRRLIVHESIADALVARLKRAVRQRRSRRSARAGHADRSADRRGGVRRHEARARRQNRARRRCAGRLLRPPGDRRSASAGRDACFKETFAPILYVLRYRDFDEAIALHNAVPQGLSSSIFTTDLREAELFLSAAGSDCGIANVNIGPSGAEIGGAFGGEKETGGGRESGSDAGAPTCGVRPTRSITGGTCL